MRFTSNPEKQHEIEKLSAALKEASVRDIIGYSELSGIVGYSVQEHPFTLQQARKAVEKETGFRFETVRAVGVKKLDAASVHGIGAVARKRIGRHARRQAKRLVGLSYNLDRKEQGRVDIERSLLGALGSLASTKPEKIAHVVNDGPVVAAKVLEALR